MRNIFQQFSYKAFRKWELWNEYFSNREIKTLTFWHICNMLEAEQDSINKRTCIVHHIALIQNSATYTTEAIIIEKTPRVTSSVDTLHINKNFLRFFYRHCF